MKNNVQLQKLVLGASLTALSVVIDVFFKVLLQIPNFGLPFYAIPIIIGAIMLGPVYGGIMALVGDAVAVLIVGVGYLPLFALGSMMWGIVPGLLLYKRYNAFRLASVIFLSYLLASSINTIAITVYYTVQASIPWFILRMTLIPFNSLIIFHVVKDLHKKLIPVFESSPSSKVNIKA
jgi:ECF transporter S component (folate family)